MQARLGDDGKSFVTLADKFEGKRFNSPNDSVYMSNGDLYFTDPPYGLPLKNDDPKKEIPFNGVYRISKDGKVTLLTKEMTYPNGIAFSPDEKTLYVANSDPKMAIWKAFPVNADGTIKRAGGIALFANVRQLIAHHAVGPNAQPLTLRPEATFPTVAGPRAPEYQGNYKKLRKIESDLARGMNLN